MLPQTPSPEGGPLTEHENYLAQRRRRMNFWVGLVALMGAAGLGLVFVYGKYLTIYQEHYEFRRAVKVGTTEQEILDRYGRPYRTYWTRRDLDAVLAGRGHYKSFDLKGPLDIHWAHEEQAEQSQTSVRVEGVVKVLHYRPTPEHGEFVLIGEDGRVVAVFTGRP